MKFSAVIYCIHNVISHKSYLYNIGWLLFGGYKNILPEMLTILPESKSQHILVSPEKEPSNTIINFHHIGLCVSSILRL